jgi:hypothetical protein
MTQRKSYGAKFTPAASEAEMYAKITGVESAVFKLPRRGGRKRWVVTYEINSGEFIGTAIIEAVSVVLTGAGSFWADGVDINVEEAILDIVCQPGEANDAA